MTIIKLAKKYNQIIFPIFDSLINVLNLFSHIFISWFVSQNDYGIINALLSFSAILMVVGVALQTFVAKRIADPNWHDNQLRSVEKISNKLIVILAVVLMILSPLLTILLRADILAIGSVIAIFLVNSKLSIYRGILQGKKRFLSLNRSFYIEALIRVILTMVLFTLFNNIIMALLSILIGMMTALIVDRRSLTKLIEKKGQPVDFNKKKSKDLKIILAANFFFYYFTSISIIMVNYFIPELSGVFAVSVKYSQIFIHIGCSIITVIIPIISKYKYNYRIFRKKALQYLCLCIGMGAIGLTLYVSFLPKTVTWIFGSEYSQAKDLIFIQGLGYFIFIIGHYLVSMDIVIEEGSFIKFMALAGVIMTIALMNFNNSLIQIITVEITTYLTLMLILIMKFFIGGKTNEIKKQN